jgi:deoxyribonuclease-4
MKIGCHVSIAGGVQNAPGRAKDFGCEAFQMFTRSPQGGPAPVLTPAVVKAFEAAMAEHALTEFVVHTPYFINFGSGNPRTYHGSVSVVAQELERANVLGARFVMCHLGSFKDVDPVAGFKQVLEGLDAVMEKYTGTTTKFLVEIAAGAGAIIGDSFEQLGRIAKHLSKYKTFGGICFDTQHAFAAGYDLRTAAAVKKTFTQFEKEIGMGYMAMVHANDSKVELGAKKDRHEHIGDGLVGEEGFAAIMRAVAALEKKTKVERPLILETEHGKVVEDIKLLKKIRSKL